MHRSKISYKIIRIYFLLTLFILLVFGYDYFLNYLSYLDELIGVVFLVFLVFSKKIKLLKVEYGIIGLLLFVLILGLSSNAFTTKKNCISSNRPR